MRFALPIELCVVALFLTACDSRSVDGEVDIIARIDIEKGWLTCAPDHDWPEADEVVIPAGQNVLIDMLARTTKPVIPSEGAGYVSYWTARDVFTDQLIHWHPIEWQCTSYERVIE